MFMCIGVLPAHLSWGIRCPGIRVTDSCELAAMWVLEWNPGPLEDQPSTLNFQAIFFFAPSTVSGS